MMKRIVIIQAHVSAPTPCLGRMLADTYASSAEAAGHAVRWIDVARLDFGRKRSALDWNPDSPPRPLREAQLAVKWADHLAVFFPLWLSTVPAVVDALFDQVLRPGVQGDGGFLIGTSSKSAHLIATVAMPAAWNRWYVRTHRMSEIERAILAFGGLLPVRETLVGAGEGKSVQRRARWLHQIEECGRRAA